MQIIGIDIILGGGEKGKNLLCFFLNGSGFEKWEELIMDQKYETKLVLHLGILTSRALLTSPRRELWYANNNEALLGGGGGVVYLLAFYLKNYFSLNL